MPSENFIESKFREDVSQIDDNGMTGLEELEFGAKRLAVDDKKMINCRADLNQLVPFKYNGHGRNI